MAQEAVLELGLERLERPGLDLDLPSSGSVRCLLLAFLQRLHSGLDNIVAHGGQHIHTIDSSPFAEGNFGGDDVEIRIFALRYASPLGKSLRMNDNILPVDR